MPITIPELPNADYNKKLRLWITSDQSYLASCFAAFIDVGGLSRIKNPVILLQDMETNRIKKTTLEDFIAYLEDRVSYQAGEEESTQEILQEALAIMYQISLVGSLPDKLQQELESFLWRNYDRE